MTPNPSPSAPQEVPQWAKDASKAIWDRPDDMEELNAPESYILDKFAAIITRHAQPALTAATEENERLRREVENWKGACLESDKTKCELRATVDYLQNYVIPEKDKHGKYWHDLAQERLADRSTMETRHGELVAQRLVCAQEADKYRLECDRLKEEVKAHRACNGYLRADLDKRIADFLSEKACCNGHECGCYGVTRLEQLVEAEAAAQLTAQRQWTEQAREAMKLAVANYELEHPILKQNPHLACTWYRFAVTLLQSHPAATNLTEEGK